MEVTVDDEYKTSCQILGTTHFQVTKLPSENFVINNIVAIAFSGVLIIPTLLLNGVAVITIFKSSQLSSKPCYYIILIQSMFDFAVGMFAIPSYIYYLANSIGGMTNCFAAVLARRLTVSPIGGSSIALTAMTVERYIAILHPFSYKTQVTKQRLLKYVGAIATVEFLVIILSFKSARLLEIYLILKATLVFVITAYVYTRIYLVVKKLDQSLKKPNDAAGMNLTRTKLFLQQIRQARSCFMVVVCYFALCFLPPLVVVPFSKTINAFNVFAIRTWFFSITILNSVANSLIFFWTKTMLRKEALKVLHAA